MDCAMLTADFTWLCEYSRPLIVSQAAATAISWLYFALLVLPSADWISSCLERCQLFKSRCQLNTVFLFLLVLLSTDSIRSCCLPEESSNNCFSFHVYNLSLIVHCLIDIGVKVSYAASRCTGYSRFLLSRLVQLSSVTVYQASGTAVIIL